MFGSEIAERLIRERGITSGHWGIYVRFGLGATNVGSAGCLSLA
jgi:hypothetical protein